MIRDVVTLRRLYDSHPHAAPWEQYLADAAHYGTMRDGALAFAFIADAEDKSIGWLDIAGRLTAQTFRALRAYATFVGFRVIVSAAQTPSVRRFLFNLGATHVGADTLGRPLFAVRVA